MTIRTFPQENLNEYISTNNKILNLMIEEAIERGKELIQSELHQMKSFFRYNQNSIILPISGPNKGYRFYTRDNVIILTILCPLPISKYPDWSFSLFIRVFNIDINNKSVLFNLRAYIEFYNKKTERKLVKDLSFKLLSTDSLLQRSPAIIQPISAALTSSQNSAVEGPQLPKDTNIASPINTVQQLSNSAHHNNSHDENKVEKNQSENNTLEILIPSTVDSNVLEENTLLNLATQLTVLRSQNHNKSELKSAWQQLREQALAYIINQSDQMCAQEAVDFIVDAKERYRALLTEHRTFTGFRSLFNSFYISNTEIRLNTLIAQKQLQVQLSIANFT